MFHEVIEQFDDISVIPANQFYARLKGLKVRRTASDEPNLTRFLACEEDEDQLRLDLQKVILATEEFLRNNHLKSYG